MSETTTGSALAAAICAVMREVRVIEKTGYNAFHRFKYSSDEDIVAALQPAMARHGLALIPTHMAHEWSESRNIEKEGDRCALAVTFKLIHAPSGEFEQLMAIGVGCDKADKGIYKALTGARKNLLTQLFLMPRSEDPDAYGEPPEEERQQRGRGQPQGLQEWGDAQREGFINGLKSTGFTLDEVTRWCESLQSPRPSRLPEERRQALLKAISEGGGARGKLEAFLRGGTRETDKSGQQAAK